jgi:hypothetical protein
MMNDGGRVLLLRLKKTRHQMFESVIWVLMRTQSARVLTLTDGFKTNSASTSTRAHFDKWAQDKQHKHQASQGIK